MRVKYTIENLGIINETNPVMFVCEYFYVFVCGLWENGDVFGLILCVYDVIF